MIERYLKIVIKTVWIFFSIFDLYNESFILQNTKNGADVFSGAN